MWRFIVLSDISKLWNELPVLGLVRDRKIWINLLRDASADYRGVCYICVIYLLFYCWPLWVCNSIYLDTYEYISNDEFHLTFISRISLILSICIFESFFYTFYWLRSISLQRPTNDIFRFSNISPKLNKTFRRRTCHFQQNKRLRHSQIKRLLIDIRR